MSQSDKFLIGGGSPAGSPKSVGSTPKTIHMGIVKSVVKKSNLVTLKVRVNGLDNNLSDNQLPVVYPFDSALKGVVIPKKGEVVRVILSDVNTPYQDRLWVGPVITDFLNLDGQVYPAGDRMTVNEEGFNNIYNQPHASNLSDIGDVIPNMDKADDDAVHFLSRGNVDMSFQGNSLIIRSGKYDKGDKKKKNRKNPATFQIHFSEDGEFSSINLSADLINMFTHNGNPLVPEARNGKLTDEQIKELAEQLHPLLYGDLTLELLSLMRQVLVEDHVHPYNGQPAIKSALVKKLQSFNLDSILSPNIKIN
jgi:hypothetical protein